MFQKLSLGNFKGIEGTSEFNEDFVKSYNYESNGICFLEVDVQYPKFLQNSLNDLPFLPEKIKTEKVEKLVANLRHKKEYVIHIRNLKQALNCQIRIIKFNKKAQLEPHIDMKTDLGKATKDNFLKELFEIEG